MGKQTGSFPVFRLPELTVRLPPSQVIHYEVGALLDPHQRQLNNPVAKPEISFSHDPARRHRLLPILLALGVLRKNVVPIWGEENPLIVGMNFRRRLDVSWNRQAAEREIADNIRYPTIHQDRLATPKSLMVGTQFHLHEFGKKGTIGQGKAAGEWRSNDERKYYLSNLPAEATLKQLAAAIKARLVCERAHQQMMEELELNHFESRSWQGLHRHALMTMIAYAFLQHQRINKAKREKDETRPA